jgi:hypothetical protein
MAWSRKGSNSPQVHTSPSRLFGLRVASHIMMFSQEIFNKLRSVPRVVLTKGGGELLERALRKAYKHPRSYTPTQSGSDYVGGGG